MSKSDLSGSWISLLGNSSIFIFCCSSPNNGRSSSRTVLVRGIGDCCVKFGNSRVRLLPGEAFWSTPNELYIPDRFERIGDSGKVGVTIPLLLLPFGPVILRGSPSERLEIKSSLRNTSFRSYTSTDPLRLNGLEFGLKEGI